MVMKVMRWRMRHLFSKKYQVNLTLHALEGPALEGLDGSQVLVDVKWKGPKGALGSRFRRSMKSARGLEGRHDQIGAVRTIVWEQKFEHVCVLSLAKTADCFLPWDVYFVIRQVVLAGSKTRQAVVGTVFVNLAAFASPTGNTCQNQRLPVICTIKGVDTEATLVATFSFVELRTVSDGPVSVRIMAPSLPCMGGPLGWREVDEDSGMGGGAVKVSKASPAAGKGKKSVASTEDDVTDDGKLSPRSEDSAQESVIVDPFDSDSTEDLEEEYEEEDIVFVKSFSYGTIAGANLVIEGALPFHQDDVIVGEATADVISIHSRTASVGIPKASEQILNVDADQAVSQPSMRSLLSWRKRKLSFRSPRSRGEPLLNKAYGEEGGDEIDWDRRMCGSPNEPLSIAGRTGDELALMPSALDFGEGLFSVGTWEHKEVESRDRQLKLSTNVFFASFDQRSESAAGESACTALVAVIADWLHKYPTFMPSKAEFDMLIRDGSAEWRKLCEVESYRSRFADGHFDLETVLQAGVRPLVVVAEKSYVGFFKPEGLGDSVEFLQGAMTFDGIWEEIEKAGPAVYIVSWNDHFFVLKVEENAYYIIDTLGERLYEGCSQAYILQFDDRSCVCQLVPEPETEAAAAGVSQGSAAKTEKEVAKVEKEAPKPEKEGPKVEEEPAKAEAGGKAKVEGESSVEKVSSSAAEVAACIGKKACCEFVKGFFAALPLRELEKDIKKGLLEKIPLHQRLQIEFHYTTTQSTSGCMDLISF